MAAQNANQRNETFMKAYKNGEDWLMNGDDDSLIKAIINRLRSAPGEGVEDLAYLINDVAPWYKPAKEVVDKNVAGNIAATADRQFEKAKEKTGDFGDRLIDSADSGAEMLGLSILGPKAFTYVFGSKEGFEEYRAQRENGTPQELAFKRALAKTGYSIIEEKVEDFIGKNNPIDDVLYSQSGIVRKLDSNKIKSYNEEKLSKQEFARLQSAVTTYHPGKKGYIEQRLDNENGDPAIIYDVYIREDGSMIVFGRSGGKNIHEREEKYDVNKKRR